MTCGHTEVDYMKPPPLPPETGWWLVIAIACVVTLVSAFAAGSP